VIGTRYALAVSSCSAAMFLALAALGLRPGARVRVPAFTFAAVPSAVVHAGAVPVLAEVGGDLRLDLGDVERRMQEGIDALLVSHMRGHTSDMDALMALAARHDVPLVEDAAHSLGTRWDGRMIGGLGAMGCFSFQSYKLVNGGEGGMLVSDDADLMARAVIMSGAYEENWKKHPEIGPACECWQNRLPLYNMRMSNLSAVVIRAQMPEIARRVRDGRTNHDRLAAALRAHPLFEVPEALAPEERAPDSLQFLIAGAPEPEAMRAFAEMARAAGAPVALFGAGEGNARVFWNWAFLGTLPDLPVTRAVLLRAADLRLPAYFTADQVDAQAVALISAAEAVFPVSGLRAAGNA